MTKITPCENFHKPTSGLCGASMRRFGGELRVQPPAVRPECLGFSPGPVTLLLNT